MKINIISVGKLSRDFTILSKHYKKMIKWKIIDNELTYNKKIPVNLIKSYEAKLIIQHLNLGSYKIILDVLGRSVTSEDFSLIFKDCMMSGKNIDIVIGGAYGLDDIVINAADITLSLSKMTMPHQLAKLFLLEQIYRSQTINERHPYHK